MTSVKEYADETCNLINFVLPKKYKWFEAKNISNRKIENTYKFPEKAQGTIFYLEYNSMGLLVYREDIDASFVFELELEEWKLMHIRVGAVKFESAGFGWQG